MEALARAGATSPANARPLADIPADPDGGAARRLRARAVLREAAPGTFYVDLEAWRAVRQTRISAIAVSISAVMCVAVFVDSVRQGAPVYGFLLLAAIVAAAGLIALAPRARR